MVWPPENKTGSEFKSATRAKVSRIFFALWPDSSTRGSIHSVRSRFTEKQGRFIEKDNLHLTLSFIGNVNEEQLQIYAEAAEYVNSVPFELVLDRIGYFSRTCRPLHRVIQYAFPLHENMNG